MFIYLCLKYYLYRGTWVAIIKKHRSTKEQKEKVQNFYANFVTRTCFPVKGFQSQQYTRYLYKQKTF